jgi:LysM repeat protein
MRLPRPYFVLATWIMCVMPGPAQEPEAEDLSALAEKMDRQQAQINELIQEVKRLASLLENRQQAAQSPTVRRAEPLSGTPEPAGPTHQVQKGETLTSIAKQYSVTVDELKALNEISDERRLQIGQVLKLPEKQSDPKGNEPETPQASPDLTD